VIVLKQENNTLFLLFQYVTADSAIIKPLIQELLKQRR